MLKDEGCLDDTLIKKVLTWRHNSGFSVHKEVRLQAGDASFICEHRVIKKILVHLGLLRGEEQKRGTPVPPKKCSEIFVEPFDDGWYEYEETFIEVQA